MSMSKNKNYGNMHGRFFSHLWTIYDYTALIAYIRKNLPTHNSSGFSTDAYAPMEDITAAGSKDIQTISIFTA